MRQALPRRPLFHLTHPSNHCFWLSHFTSSWKEAKVITLPKPSKYPKFPQNLLLISLLFTTGKMFEKGILKVVQRHIQGSNLLNANQFGFRDYVSVHEAYGPRDPKLQQKYAHGFRILGCRKML